MSTETAQQGLRGRSPEPRNGAILNRLTPSHMPERGGMAELHDAPVFGRDLNLNGSFERREAEGEYRHLLSLLLVALDVEALSDALQEVVPILGPEDQAESLMVVGLAPRLSTGVRAEIPREHMAGL